MMLRETVRHVGTNGVASVFVRCAEVWLPNSDEKGLRLLRLYEAQSRCFAISVQSRWQEGVLW